MEFETEDEMVFALFVNVVISYEKVLRKKNRRNYGPERTFVKHYNGELYRQLSSDDDAFIKKHVRVSARSLHRMLLVFEQNNLGYGTKFKLCVFLYWLASGASYRVTGVSFGISRYSVRTIIHNMLNLFVCISKKIIKLPIFEEYEQIANHFNSRANTNVFSKAIGAIDGCHVKITVPTHLHDQYINRKLDYSLNIMAICDSFGKFVNIVAGYPGSVHDQRVLRNSNIYKTGNFPPPGYFLLGDSGYKCALTPVPIITPFRKDHLLTSQETRFNLLHSRARSVIENAFGQMKTRWRSIFLKNLELMIENSIKTVLSCCVMHNICLNDGMDLEDSVISQFILHNETIHSP